MSCDQTMRLFSLQLEALDIAGQLHVALAFYRFTLFGPGHRHGSFPLGDFGAPRGVPFLINKLE